MPTSLPVIAYQPCKYALIIFFSTQTLVCNSNTKRYSWVVWPITRNDTFYVLVNTASIHTYTPGKKYGIFVILAIFCIFVECAGCFCTWNTFPRANISLGGVNLHLTAKWSAMVQKQLFRHFSQFDCGYKSCPFVRLLPYPFICCIEILCTIPLLIYCLFWCG